MTPATILVVDDETDIRDRIGELVQCFGFQALTAATGEAALRAVVADKPDMALVDLRLPDTTGIELTQRLRADHQSLPVAIVTGYASVPTAVEAIRSGAFDFLEKPLKVQQLQRIISKGLRLARGSKASYAFATRMEQRLVFQIPGDLEAVDGALHALKLALEIQLPAGSATAKDLLLAAEELLVNAIIHGCGLEPERLVEVEFLSDGQTAMLVVGDQGPGFDASWLADAMSEDDTRALNGHGLLLVHSLADRLCYEDGGRTARFVKGLT